MAPVTPAKELRMRLASNPAGFTFLLTAVGIAMGCAPAAGAGSRPVPLLTDADRVPDPSCSATWVAAITARVVDGDARPVAGAHVAPCIRLGDGIGTCLTPVDTDARGWALWSVAPEHRCLERVALRVLVPGRGHAASYQALALTPIDAVIDVQEDLVVVETFEAIERSPLGDPSAPHEIRFAGDVTLTVRPESMGDATSYGQTGLRAMAGADAPSFMHQAGEPDLVFALSPDAELLEPASLSLPAPGGARDGTSFEVMVLGGIYTPLADGSIVEEGALRTFARATVSGGRLTVEGLPRLGWIGFVRR